MTASKVFPLTLTALVALALLAMPQGTTGAAPAAADFGQAPRASLGGGLDALSADCLSCHDGTQARFIAARAAGTPVSYEGHRSLDHPIGMPYRDYPVREPGSYRHLLSLDPSIRLIDGKVACVSCHRLKQRYALAAREVSAWLDHDRRECPASAELARDARTNSLCLACHLM